MPANGETPRTSDEVRAQIEDARTQIATSAAALRQEMALQFDWREWIRKRPGIALAGAFGLGFLFGSRD